MVNNSTANAGDMGLTLGPEGPLEKEIAIHSSILAWKSHGQWSLAGYSPKVKESESHSVVSDSLRPHDLEFSRPE